MFPFRDREFYLAQLLFGSSWIYFIFLMFLVDALLVFSCLNGKLFILIFF